MGTWVPVAGGLVTMSRAQSANQEDHLADNVVKCVCEQASGTYCTYRNRCSKHRQTEDQDHVVDVVQRNNVCKHKLLYKSTWTIDPMEKCSVLFSFSLGTFDVLHCRAIQTLWTKRLRLSVWKFNFWQLSFWIQGQALEVKSIEIRFMLGFGIGHLQFRTCNLRFLNPSWICVDLGIWLTL